MTQYWWVNHKQTVRQEIEGQYLWSPKTRKDGAHNQFYSNMRRASPGDLVLSFANQKISYIGRVVDFAFTASKPPEFGDAGSNWLNEGWYLPVYWTALANPVRPKAIIQRLGPLLPRKYSPIDPFTGDGRQAVYLAAVSEEVFIAIVEGLAFDSESLRHGGENSLTFQSVSEFLDDQAERTVAADTNLSQTTKEGVIQARRGQGKFRANVESVEHACRLTGITNRALLIASHIKPWRVCTTAHERLDGMNGLLLTPDADLLFDRGFITFQDDGEVKVSSRADKHDLRRLGFEQLVRERFGLSEAPTPWRTEAFNSNQTYYLDYHRKQVFVS